MIDSNVKQNATMKTSKLDPNTPFVNLMFDAGWKAVYADRQNEKLLIDLINTILPAEFRVKRIKQYLDREQSSDFAEGKSVRLDLVCQGEDDTMYSIEVQKAEDRNFFQRCVYYSSKLYGGQLNKGLIYESLHPVFLIAIIGFPMNHEKDVEWDTDNFISRYKFIEERTGEIAPSTIMINFAEMALFTKTLEECRSKRDFLFYWFQHGWEYEENGVPAILKGIPEIEELTEATRVAGFSAEKRVIYNQEIMNELDRLSQLKTAEIRGEEKGLEKGMEKGKEIGREEGRVEGMEKGLEKGLKKGREEGAKNKAIETAKAFLKKGIDPAVVAECTGLSIEEVQDLQE